MRVIIFFVCRVSICQFDYLFRYVLVQLYKLPLYVFAASIQIRTGHKTYRSKHRYFLSFIWPLALKR